MRQYSMHIDKDEYHTGLVVALDYHCWSGTDRWLLGSYPTWAERVSEHALLVPDTLIVLVGIRLMEDTV